MLKLVGMSADVEIRYEATGEPMRVSDMRFTGALVADVFSFILRTADLKYRVVDDTTIVVTNR